jgi:hypothetical protein
MLNLKRHSQKLFIFKIHRYTELITVASQKFSVNCIKKLLDYGCLITGETGEHALIWLSLTNRYDCGVEKHAEMINRHLPPLSLLHVSPVTGPPLSSGTSLDERHLLYSSATPRAI